MFSKQFKLSADQDIEYHIHNLNLPFNDYIAHSKNLIKTYHPHADEKIIEANSPFELRPPQQKIKYGALLTHGLFDSPFIMRDIGLKLQAEGLLVRSILLPGHGTHPGNLLNIKYEDWLQALRYGIASFKNEVEKIFLVGFSTGASLSIYHTLLDSTQIAGLILLAPAFKILSPFALITNWHHTISWLIPRTAFLALTPEIDYTKYSSIPFNAVYQVYRLTKAIKEIDHTVEPPCPLWVTLSYEDRVVCSKTTIKQFCLYQNPRNKMLLYKAAPFTAPDARISLRNSAYPDLNILDMSHIGIPLAPTNFHYGKDGDYPLASHVNSKQNIYYGAYDRNQINFYDFLYRMKLLNFERQRLTFNPDFEFMANEIREFIINTNEMLP